MRVDYWGQAELKRAEPAHPQGATSGVADESAGPITGLEPEIRTAGKSTLGTVKWYNPAKGYGFITRRDSGADVFVHASAVENAGYATLKDNQEIEFEIVSNRGKYMAENLKLK